MAKVFVTIEHARSILGARGKKMTDKQIADLLATLRLLCNKIIESVIKEKYSKSNGEIIYDD